MTTSNAQAARLLDVLVFGPLMVRAARDQNSEYFSTALTLIGIGTIVYNGYNFLQNRESGELGSCCQSCAQGRTCAGLMHH